jgi:hypothetical protein
MMDLREIDCEDWRWMKLAQDCVQWRAFVLAVLKFRFCYYRVNYLGMQMLCFHEEFIPLFTSHPFLLIFVEEVQHMD